MLGWFGVDIPALREWLKATGQERPSASLSYYVTNEGQFQKPAAIVSEADLPKLEGWIDAIHARVQSLPSNVEEMTEALGQGERHLQLLREANQEFWLGFNQWRTLEGTDSRARF